MKKAVQSVKRPPRKTVCPSSVRKKTSVFIVDDHQILRDVLKELLSGSGDFEVCGEAAGMDDALRAIRSIKPDLAIVDLELQESSGLDLIRHLREEVPGFPTLVLSMYPESLYGVHARASGASGYVMKGFGSTDVMMALRTIRAGGLFFERTPAAKGGKAAR